MAKPVYSQDEFLKRKGQHCPGCRSSEHMNYVECGSFIDGKTTIKFLCEKCGSWWIVEFEMTGYYMVDPPNNYSHLIDW